MKKLLAIVAVAGLLFAVQPVQEVQADPDPAIQFCQFIGTLVPGGILGFNTGKCVALYRLADNNGNTGPVALCRFFKDVLQGDFPLGQCVSNFR